MLTKGERHCTWRVKLMTLAWKEGYTTGVSELDAQHQQVFELLNALGSLIDRGIYDDRAVDMALASLGEDLHRHFCDEEACLSKHQRPMAEKNKQEHSEMLRIYLDFQSGRRGSKSLAALQGFHTAAEDWLLEHVCFVDVHLRSCIIRAKD